MLLDENFLEVSLIKNESFPIITETLTRVGKIQNNKDVIQECFLLHKTGRYYLVHYKELLFLDGIIRREDILEEDYSYRNTVASLLFRWGFVDIVPERFYFSFNGNIKSLKEAREIINEKELISKYFLNEILKDNSLRKTLKNSVVVIKTSEKEIYNFIPKYIIGKENPYYKKESL